MGVPQVVIVGRPNVGKSSIFNWLACRRLAIVDDMPGVTRDRLTYLMFEEGRYFELVDTGGMGQEEGDSLSAHVEDQIQTAIASASVILLVVDARRADASRPGGFQAVALRRRARDLRGQQDRCAFDGKQRPGIPPLGPRQIDFRQRPERRGRDELLSFILERLPEDSGEAPPTEAIMKVAIVGRQNTGKSTFVNTLAHAERMITSEIPGTTRDSVDVRFELDGKAFVAIDTPGLKRKSSISSDVEFYSTHRAERSIRRADVVLLFLDAGQAISKVDKQLAQYIAEQYKPCVFVVNKWDLLAGTMPTEKWVRYVHDSFRTMTYAPIAFITGQAGKNVKALLNHSQMLFKQSMDRVSTSDLNKLVRAALDKNPPPLHRGKRPKIYYATQVGVQPPTIVLFASDPHAMDATYRRYLLGVFRDRLAYGEVPIKLYLRQRESLPAAAEA